MGARKIILPDESQLTTKVAYSGGNPLYVGTAPTGAATSLKVWQIKKLTYSGDDVTDLQFAGGSNQFDKAWDDRATYSYS